MTDQHVARIEAAATRIRLGALTMGEVQGQGYIGQALGIADVLAVFYAREGGELRHRPRDPGWEGRDRFLLSIGHYAIALYAALATRETWGPAEREEVAALERTLRSPAAVPTPRPGTSERRPTADSATD